MKIFNRIILLVFVIGVSLVAVAFSQGLDLRNLGDFFIDDEAYGDQIEYVSTTVIDEININVDTRHIIVKESETDDLYLTYYSKEDDTWTINESNGVLSLIQKSQPTSFSWFKFKFGSYEVMSLTLFIPSDLSLDYTLLSDTGEIKYIDGPSQANHVNVETDTGSIKLENIDLNSLSVKVDTGTVRVKDLNTLQDIDVLVDTGSVYVDEVTSNNLDIYTNTGSIIVTNSFISALMDLETDTGSINVEESSANAYDLRSDLGSVDFEHSTLANMSCDLQTDTGSIRVNGDAQGKTYRLTNGSIMLNIEVDTGSITVNILD
ncbi:MAG: DUF4097 domain-containing protein [Acholeplasmataceae bacterium]|nr:DUF4097 domain-containing protein [Acholeplasmataceae bacterium]